MTDREHPQCPVCRRRYCVVYLSPEECQCTKCGIKFPATTTRRPGVAGDVTQAKESCL